jgi:hypothetical protein
MEHNPYLRPMGLGEILDASIKLYRKKFFTLTCFLLAYILFSRYVLKQATLGIFGQFSPDILTYYLLSGTRYLWIICVLVLIHTVVVYPLVLSAVTRVASDSILENPQSVKKAYARSFPPLWKMGLTNLTISVVVSAVVVVSILATLIIFLFLGADIMSRTQLLIGAFIILIPSTFIPALLLWTFWAAAYPIMVNESVFGVKSLRRSWSLVKGQRIKVFFSMCLIFMIPSIVHFTSFVLESFVYIRPDINDLVSTFVSQGVLMPLVHVTRVVIYFELKARKEGLDLERRVETLSESSP